MRILALDFGTKQIGMALADSALDVVFPFGVCLTAEKEQLYARIKEERIQQLIIGLPLGLEGEENKNTKRVREFAHELQKSVDIPMVFEDERFTTHQAKNMGGTVSADEKSAMIILEQYLQKQKNQKASLN